MSDDGQLIKRNSNNTRVVHPDPVALAVETLHVMSCVNSLTQLGNDIRSKLLSVADLAISAARFKQEGNEAMFRSQMKAALDLEHATIGDCESTAALSERLGYPDEQVEEVETQTDNEKPEPTEYDSENPPPGRSTVTIVLDVAGSHSDIDQCVENLVENGALQDLINNAHEESTFSQMLVLGATSRTRKTS